MTNSSTDNMVYMQHTESDLSAPSGFPMTNYIHMELVEGMNKPPYIDVLSLFVARMRESTGCSRTELAEKAGIPEPVVTQIENGKRVRLGMRVKRSLAQALCIDTNELSIREHQDPIRPDKARMR